MLSPLCICYNIEVWDRKGTNQLKRCLIFWMYAKELDQSSQCRPFYWTHTILNGMMIWLIYMLIIHNINNTWCICLLCRFCSFTTTTCFSIIKISNSLQKQYSDIHSCIRKCFTPSIRNKFFVATSLTSTFKWEPMNLLMRENTFLRVKRWRGGSGSQPIFKKLLLDATDNHSRMMLVILLILSFFYKISLEDTLMIQFRSHSPLERIWLVFDRILK